MLFHKKTVEIPRENFFKIEIIIRVIHAFLNSFRGIYVRPCESFSNLIALILGYSESTGTFITRYLVERGGTLGYNRFKMACSTLWSKGT